MPAETWSDNAELQLQAQGAPQTPVSSHVLAQPSFHLLRFSLLALSTDFLSVLRAENSADLAEFWASNQSQ